MNIIFIRVASAYFLLGSILMYTDKEIINKSLIYWQTPLKKKDQAVVCSNLSWKSFPELGIYSQYK